MFTIDTVVDQNVKSAKQLVSFVQDETVRKELDLLVDAQAKYTKTVCNTVMDLTKATVENFGKFDAKSMEWSNWFPKSK
jgi:hypothetical protein